MIEVGEVVRVNGWLIEVIEVGDCTFLGAYEDGSVEWFNPDSDNVVKLR